jgi:hypothetical protein
VPIVARTTKQDKVRELQRTLYRAAKADPGRRFHALYDKVHRRDVLERAWELVRANKGAAGIDRQTIAAVEQYGVSRLLDELAADLRGGRWRPLPARRVFIEKPGREELRPLSIPAVRDRVVGAAVKLVSLRSILAELGLELKPAKTRIVHLREGGEGLDFLGFYHRRVRGERGYRHLRFLARWPSREAMQRARDRIREITESKRLRDPVEVIVHELNQFLRGWANYFRYGNSRLHFTRITTYARRRLALFVAKRHKRASGYGMTVVAYVSPNRMGLISLDRLVVTPSPFRDWRAKPYAAGEGRR